MNTVTSLQAIVCVCVGGVEAGVHLRARKTGTRAGGRDSGSICPAGCTVDPDTRCAALADSLLMFCLHGTKRERT